MTIKIINNNNQHDHQQDDLSQNHHHHHRDESSSTTRLLVVMDEEEYSIFNFLMKEEEEEEEEGDTTDTTSSDDMNPVPIDPTDALCSSLTMTCKYEDLLTFTCMAVAKDEYTADGSAAAADSSKRGTNNEKALISPHKRSSQGKVTDRCVSEDYSVVEDCCSECTKRCECAATRTRTHTRTRTCSSTATSTSTAKSIMNKGKWTEEEHALFLQGLEFYGSGKWALIASLVKTRTHLQIRTHAQKHFQKLASMAKDEGEGEGEGELEPACWDFVNVPNHNQTTRSVQV